MKVQLFGRGSHGSQPQTAIDPVIMAASAALRLQTIVSREIAPIDSAVLTIGHCRPAPRKTSSPTRRR
jgi:hippurate hydrolase